MPHYQTMALTKRERNWPYVPLSNFIADAEEDSEYKRDKSEGLFNIDFSISYPVDYLLDENHPQASAQNPYTSQQRLALSSMSQTNSLIPGSVRLQLCNTKWFTRISRCKNFILDAQIFCLTPVRPSAFIHASHRGLGQLEIASSGRTGG